MPFNSIGLSEIKLAETNKSARDMKMKQEQEYNKMANTAIKLVYKDIQEYISQQVADAKSLKSLKKLKLPKEIIYKIDNTIANFYAFVGWQSRVKLNQLANKAKRGIKFAEFDTIFDMTDFDLEIPNEDLFLSSEEVSEATSGKVKLNVSLEELGQR